MEMDLVKRSLQHIWNPCSQMKDYETHPLFVIKSAKGAYVELENGQKLIDAISSWWCHSLGHGHPKLKAALLAQMEKFEHVIFADTTYEAIIKLSEKLAGLTKTLKRVSFASDGSCAVEIAMKMSLHARYLLGEHERCEFMALENAYHGETGLALSVSDLGRFREPYAAGIFPRSFLKGVPYVLNTDDPLWDDCSSVWPELEAQLDQHADKLTALLVEPIVQASAGMFIYSQDFLRRLRTWAQKHNVHLIADEIMTGIGRTGLPLACQYADIEPNFLCLSKGLTSGFVPFSVTLTTDEIYHLFHDDYDKGKTFFHSHTHSGNALGAAVALACLEVMEQENIYKNVQNNAEFLKNLMQDISDQTGKLMNVRHIGAVVAADLINPNNIPRLGHKVFQEAMKLGVILRPLGNTIYWVPPLNVEREVLVKLKEITKAAVMAIF
jgi:adenosylmethionine---8-amino-7-oxononanoate aminotransferase